MHVHTSTPSLLGYVQTHVCNGALGATTNSDHGVTDMNKVQPALAKMAEVGMPLCVHGEVTDKSIGKGYFQSQSTTSTFHVETAILLQVW